MHKPADTRHPIHDLLKARWSPRAFATQPVEREKLLSLFEAARWSPSGGNAQPWSFIVVEAQTDPELHAKFVATLTRRNPLWAKEVPVLVLSVAQMVTPRGPNPAALYDLGQAVAHLSVQAVDLGLHIHQMGGFEADQVRALFNIPDGFNPVTVIAIGYQGDAATLRDDLREEEAAPRVRKTLAEFVFAEHWNQPAPFVVEAAEPTAPVTA